MLIVISPAKTLDFESTPVTESASQPLFLEEAEYLVKKLRRFSASQLQELFSVSEEIADLNKQRFHDWERPFHAGNARQAVLAFQGEVYRGLNAHTLTDPDFEYAEKHLFILSGLYGILRPMDLMQPYRLEMGTKWEINKNTPNLHTFWRDKVTSVLNEADVDGPLINLASIEYTKAIDGARLNREVVNCHFKDLKNGEYKTLMTYAKQARGKMARFIIRNQLSTAEELKAFSGLDYSYNTQLSNEKELVFTRDQVPTK